MSNSENAKQQLQQKFYKLPLAERLAYLVAQGYLSQAELAFLQENSSAAMLKTCSNLIENCIGFLPVPLAVLPNVPINGRQYCIPLAIEESSIVAGLNKVSKLIRENQGLVRARYFSRLACGQVYLYQVANLAACLASLQAHEKTILQELQAGILKSLYARGGKIVALEYRVLSPNSTITAATNGQQAARWWSAEQEAALLQQQQEAWPTAISSSTVEQLQPFRAEEVLPTLVLHLYCDTQNAMGANLLSQACEFMAERISQLIQQRPLLSILTNLNLKSLVQAEVFLPTANLAPSLASRVEQASNLAQWDAFRAVTHNKGIFNAIDGILLATGNDWRAVEAAAHAFASRSGDYCGLSQWQYLGSQQLLYGQMILPLQIATVGGVTSVHLAAKLNLNLLKVSSAQELGEVVAAAGLLQNLAALLALCDDKRLMQGHMSLHLHNLLAASQIADELKAELEVMALNYLREHGYISESIVKLLAEQLVKNS